MFSPMMPDHYVLYQNKQSHVYNVIYLQQIQVNWQIFLSIQHSIVQGVEHKELDHLIWPIEETRVHQPMDLNFDWDFHDQQIYRYHEGISGSFPKCCPMFHCGARLILVVQRCRPLRLLSMLRLQQLKKKIVKHEVVFIEFARFLPLETSGIPRLPRRVPITETI